MITDTREPVAESLASGLAGALVLTAVHQAATKMTPDAPRMDILAERSIARGLELMNVTPPPRRKLHAAALVGDIVSNSLFYALVGTGNPKHALGRGAVLGTIAGLGAVLLPPVIGLGTNPSARNPRTRAMAFLWYFLGGVTSGAIFSAIGRTRR